MQLDDPVQFGENFWSDSKLAEVGNVKNWERIVIDSLIFIGVIIASYIVICR